MNNDPKWLKFEKLVAKLQQELSPNAIVTHNEKIIGQITGKERQVDISIKQKIGQFDLLIAVDCKDYNKPADVNDVESFQGLLRDIQANKGAMVSANGFTSTALQLGRKSNISLFKLIDVDEHEWQTLLSIPMVCDFRRLEHYRFKIPSETAQFLSEDPKEMIIYGIDIDGKKQVSLHDLLISIWNLGKLPSEVGQHENIQILEYTSKILAGGKEIKENVLADIVIIQRLFYGELPLIKMSGLRDEYTGAILTPGFTTDYLDNEVVEKTWTQIKSVEDLAIKPFMILTALDVAVAKK